MKPEIRTVHPFLNQKGVFYAFYPRTQLTDVIGVNADQYDFLARPISTTSINTRFYSSPLRMLPRRR